MKNNVMLSEVKHLTAECCTSAHFEEILHFVQNDNLELWYALQQVNAFYCFGTYASSCKPVLVSRLLLRYRNVPGHRCTVARTLRRFAYLFRLTANKCDRNVGVDPDIRAIFLLCKL
jgi:hypothetical protein